MPDLQHEFSGRLAMGKFYSLALVWFLVILCSPLAIAASNQDILDKLDEIEFERLMQKNINEINRSSEYSGNTGLSKEFKYIGQDTKGATHLIALSTIRKNKAGNIVFMESVDSPSPRYKDNFTYFGTYGALEINCDYLTYRRISNNYFSSNTKLIKVEKYNSTLSAIPRNSLIDEYRRFLCN